MARITKKTIYANYDINYRSSDGKIESPIGWIKPLLKKGNEKVGENTWTFSIHHGNETLSLEQVSAIVRKILEDMGKTCITGSCACHCNGCYCDAGFYNMPDVRDGAIIRLILCRFFLDFVRRAILAQLQADKILLVRIHAQGDFFSADYVAMWRSVCLAY